jgi:hypothetical protein
MSERGEDIMARDTGKIFSRVAMFMGGAVGLWSVAAFISALGASQWQISALLGQYLVAIGVVKEFHTLVDFYTHIKGIEYLICAAFFVAFPVFYKYVNSPLEAEERTH